MLRVSRVVYLEGKVGVGCAEGEQGEQGALNGSTVYLEGKGGVGCAEGEQDEQDELNGQTRQTL